jgi:RNA polymerase primary sigma factor
MRAVSTTNEDRPPQRAHRLPSTVERTLALAAQRGDMAARAKFVESFVPLIGSVARIYRGSRAVDRVELMQEGVVGLLRALERYDADQGTPFWAYASWWVRQAMQSLVAELTRPVVLSDRALRQLARVKDARREHLQAHGREPTSADLAESTGFAREQVDKLVAAERAPRALDEPIGDGDDADTSFGELLTDPVAEEDYERVDRRLEIEELRELPNELCERERAILRARFGLGGQQRTLREIAGSLELSAERVRQIEERALEKLRLAASPGGPFEHPVAAAS